jgi:hypothetical protein
MIIPWQQALRDEQLLELGRIAASLEADIYNAVRYYETFLPSRTSPLTDRVNKARIHGGLMAISDALYEGAVLALARMWDTNGRTARITDVAARLKRKEVLAAVEASTGILIDRRDLKAWHREIGVVTESPHLEAIREGVIEPSRTLKIRTKMEI